MRRSYARHLTILFPAVLVVAVYFLIQPRHSDQAAPAMQPVAGTSQEPSRNYNGSDGDFYQTQRNLRRDVIVEVMTERGMIVPGMTEEQTRLTIRGLMYGSDEEQALFDEVRLRLLERGIEPGRWFGRHWEAQRQGPFSPGGVGGFEGRGVTLGDEAPPLAVLSLDGSEVALADAWQVSPALIVTGSITCPITHDRIAELDALTRRFDGRVNAVLIYTTEALPGDATAPGPVGEALSGYAQNASTPSRPQSTSLIERTQYANELRDSHGVHTTVLIDNMDNAVWQAFGQAPGAALLVMPDGKVAVKQGWFDAYAMADAIEILLAEKLPSN